MWCLGLRGPVGVVDVGNTRFETAEMGFFVWGLFSLVHCVQVVCSGHQDERRRQQTLLIRSSRHPSSGSDTKPEKQKHKSALPPPMACRHLQFFAHPSAHGDILH